MVRTYVWSGCVMPGLSIFNGARVSLLTIQRQQRSGYDETLIPVDYERSGQIRDDQIFSTLVGPMKEGVVMTCIMDCCHSGSVLDLPFVFVADGEHDQMGVPPDFDFGTLHGLFQQFMAAQASGTSGGGNSGPNDPMSVLFGQCCTIM